MDTEHQQTTTLQLVLAWGFVGIPLVFGVVQTLINSMKLFQYRRLRRRPMRSSRQAGSLSASAKSLRWLGTLNSRTISPASSTLHTEAS
jgi:hypothetical protein